MSKAQIAQDIPEDMEGISQGQKHFHKINPEMLQVYQRMARSMDRDMSPDYICTVEASVVSTKSLTMEEVINRPQPNFKDFVEQNLNERTADVLHLVYGHLDDPVKKAIFLIQSLGEHAEGNDKAYMENVLAELNRLLTYHRPFIQDDG